MSADGSPLILVVEDDAGAATLQRRRLERAGFRAVVAADTDAAMTALAQGEVDLVVIDYRLGTTTGLDLHRRMKVAGFNVPVIIVSGAIDDATVIEAMRAGVRDVVVKNLDYLDYLPDAVQGVLRQAAAVPERLSHQEHRPCVLIVEDDTGAAALQRRTLERRGYAVEIARGPEEARRIAARGQVDLGVFDLRLGDGISGLELYEELKTGGSNIPAILVTGFPDQAVAIRALRAGVRDFVPKSPDFLEYLPSAVDRVLGQVRVEQKLVESELRLASVIGTTMDAIVMCDEDSRVVLFNRSAEEMFQCSAADALSKQLDRFIPGLRLDERVRDRTAGQAGSIRQRTEVNGTTSSGRHVPIEVSVSDVVVNGKHLFTVIARDVSERRRIEAELRETDRRKDEFLGMLAHELRNPLAAITTAGEVLHRTVSDARSQKLTAVMRRQTRTLARMVDDLLDVSRVTQGKIQLAREPLLLNEVVGRAADGVREIMNTGALRFDLRIPVEPVWLNGDATRLEQVLSNLLHNAVKFTPPGGQVSLEAGQEANEAVIRVRDTGAGIDPVLLPKVFDLFVQGDTSLDRAKSGLGIGLALVRQLVALHGGSVAAFSNGPGKGSEFVVRLPAAPEERAAADDERGAEVAVVRRRMHVLVVDDQPDLADSVALLIEALGHRARAVYGGREALAAGRSDVPDVMIVDIGMPGLTGYEVARHVRGDPRLADVQLIALTGYGRQDDRARALGAGFDLHLTKPVAESTLRSVLSTAAASKQRTSHS